MSKTFEIKDVLLGGWEKFKPNALVMIGLLIISFVANIIANLALGFLPFIVSTLLVSVISSYFMLSIIKAAISVSDGQKVSFNVLKNDLTLYVKFFIVSIILSFMFMISAVLLILPLLLAMAVFFPVQYILVTKSDMAIIDIFKKSWEITTKDFGTCLLYILVCAGLAIVGAIPLGLGLLIAVPVIYIASADVYKKLDGVATTVAATSSDVISE